MDRASAMENGENVEKWITHIDLDASNILKGKEIGWYWVKKK